MIPLSIAYILNVIDYFITFYWVNLYGVDVEANPLMRWCFENNIAGFIKIGVVGAIFIGLGIIVDKYPRTVWAAYVLLAVYTMVVLYHGFLFFII